MINYKKYKEYHNRNGFGPTPTGHDALAECWHCGEKISTKESVIEINQNTPPEQDGMWGDSTLSFHFKCFKNVAGEDYVVDIPPVRPEEGKDLGIHLDKLQQKFYQSVLMKPTFPLLPVADAEFIDDEPEKKPEPDKK